MKTTKHILIALSFAVLLTINANAHCGKCAADNAKEGQEHAQCEAEENTDILPLLPHYLKAQEALATDNLDAVKVAAKALHASIHEDENTDDLKTIKESAFAISDAENIKDARKAFLALSNDMIAKTERLELPEGQELYITFCPMAFGNTGGHWLQKDKKVNNPYFGVQMLHCGSVQSKVSE